MDLVGLDATVEETSQILEPYIRDHFRRDIRFQDRLEITSFSPPGSVSISVNVLCPQTTVPAQNPFVAYMVVLANQTPPDVLEQSFVDLITLVPQEHIVSLSADLEMKPPEVLFFTMPNIERLHLSDVELSEGFLQPKPEGPRANTKLLPSLQSLYLEDILLDNHDWGHLTTYLVHQTSGDQVISLEVDGNHPYMHSRVVNEIKDLVKEFTYFQLPGEDEKTPRSCSHSSYEEDD